jgi:hypothetical protein
LQAPKVTGGSVRLPKSVSLRRVTLSPLDPAGNDGTAESLRLTLRLTGPRKASAPVKGLGGGRAPLLGDLPYALALGSPSKGVVGLTSGFAVKSLSLTPARRDGSDGAAADAGGGYNVSLLTEGVGTVGEPGSARRGGAAGARRHSWLHDQG